MLTLAAARESVRGTPLTEHGDAQSGQFSEGLQTTSAGRSRYFEERLTPLVAVTRIFEPAQACASWPCITRHPGVSLEPGLWPPAAPSASRAHRSRRPC